jgi:hypothetical protein
MRVQNVLFVLGVLWSVGAAADCEVVSSGKRVPYDGQNLEKYSIEKKSLMKLDKAYPHLNVIEKTFKGEGVTCSNCSDNFIVCN